MLPTAEARFGDKPTMVMVAVFGVAVILLVVVAVLLLRKRLVNSSLRAHTQCVCVIQINIICRHANCVIMGHKFT